MKSSHESILMIQSMLGTCNAIPGRVHEVIWRSEDWKGSRRCATPNLLYTCVQINACYVVLVPGSAVRSWKYLQSLSMDGGRKVVELHSVWVVDMYIAYADSLIL